MTAFNKADDTHIKPDLALHVLKQVSEVAALVKRKGKELTLDLESIGALFHLKPVVRAWLLQGYQLTNGGDTYIPKEVFYEISKYLLKLSATQTKAVHEQVCYSLYKDTPSTLPFWKKPFVNDQEKEDRLAKRLQISVGS